MDWTCSYSLVPPLLQLEDPSRPILGPLFRVLTINQNRIVHLKDDWTRAPLLQNWSGEKYVAAVPHIILVYNLFPAICRKLSAYNFLPSNVMWVKECYLVSKIKFDCWILMTNGLSDATVQIQCLPWTNRKWKEWNSIVGLILSIKNLTCSKWSLLYTVFKSYSIGIGHSVRSSIWLKMLLLHMINMLRFEVICWQGKSIPFEYHGFSIRGNNSPGTSVSTSIGPNNMYWC